MATGIPRRSTARAMMTMATSTVDRTTSWCPPFPLTISSSSPTLLALNASKFDACSTKQQSSPNLTILREIPTRNFQQNSPNAVVDPLDDGDNDRTTTKTTTLPPTTSEGTAAPLPYQLELATISADIARMQQRDDNTFAQTNRQMTPPTDTQSALDALSAKIDKIMNTRTSVPPYPAAMNLPRTEPTPVPTTDRLSYDDDDGADGNHQQSSIIDTFNSQTKMLRNLNTMVGELIVIVELIVDATTRPNNSFLHGQQTALLLPATTVTTICPATAFTLTDHHSNTQTTPWHPHHDASSNKIVPSPYKKRIPAKPPFNHGRLTRHLVKTRKDSLRLP